MECPAFPVRRLIDNGARIICASAEGQDDDLRVLVELGNLTSTGVWSRTLDANDVNRMRVDALGDDESSEAKDRFLRLLTSAFSTGSHQIEQAGDGGVTLTCSREGITYPIADMRPLDGTDRPWLVGLIRKMLGHTHVEEETKTEETIEGKATLRIEVVKKERSPSRSPVAALKPSATVAGSGRNKFSRMGKGKKRSREEETTEEIEFL